MLDLLAYLFSPFGKARRRDWWLAVLISGVLVPLFAWQVLISDKALQEDLFKYSAQMKSLASLLPGHRKEAKAQMLEIIHHQQMGFVRGVLRAGPEIVTPFLLIYWYQFAVTIRRWHARGKTGFLVILSFLPFLFPNLALIWIIISFWIVVELGFLGEKYEIPAYLDEDGFSFIGLVVPCLVMFVAAVTVMGLNRYRPDLLPAWMNEKTVIYVAEVVSGGKPALASPSPSADPAMPAEAISQAAPVTPSLPVTDLSFHGTADTSFAKDWVMVNGKRIDGIIRANPAPNGEVALLYGQGGMDVAAASLPQGFLDAWGLTPERLKAANP